MAETSKAAGVSDTAVRKATGKGWSEWFAALDAAGAAKMSHKEIADYLYDRLGCTGWWSEMVAVGYEQERGLREKHQSCEGAYKASASKTVAAPLASLYAAWSDDATRQRWLPEAPFTVRKATPEKSLRITWPDGTSLEVLFYARGNGKSQVAIQQSKLRDAAEVARSKAFWSESLNRLKALLEA